MKIQKLSFYLINLLSTTKCSEIEIIDNILMNTKEYISALKEHENHILEYKEYIHKTSEKINKLEFEASIRRTIIKKEYINNYFNIFYEALININENINQINLFHYDNGINSIKLILDLTENFLNEKLYFFELEAINKQLERMKNSQILAEKTIKNMVCNNNILKCHNEIFKLENKILEKKLKEKNKIRKEKSTLENEKLEEKNIK